MWGNDGEPGSGRAPEGLKLRPGLTAIAACILVLATVAPMAQAGRFRIPGRARQLIVVSSTTHRPPGYLATFRAYTRAGPASAWQLRLGPWRAETGYGHLSDHRHEGDGSTPTGVFGIQTTLYGNHPNPGGLHYRYHRLVCGDWWDEDPYSSQYNRFVHVGCGQRPAFAARSEALWTDLVAYRYLAVLRFNMGPVRGGANAPGSGIFLHSWVGGATAGCVALHETKLLSILRWLRPAAHPVVEIGTDRQIASGVSR